MRVAQIIFAVVDVFLLWLASRKPVSRLGFKEPEILARIAFGGLLVVIAWGSFESRTQGVPQGTRTPALVVVLVLLSVALIWLLISRKRNKR